MICVNQQIIKHPKTGAFIEVPCGQCVTCCQNRTKMWAERMILEARSVGFENCCFLTLTYDNLELEKRNEVLKLDKRHVQLWLKRFRKELSYYVGFRVRYYCSGEYGSRTFRPHYHCVLFGVSSFVFDDVRFTLSVVGKSYRLKSWSWGFVYIEIFGEAVAFYVAQYLGKSTPQRKRMLESMGLPPEFSLKSNGGRGGLGGLGYTELKRNVKRYRHQPVRGWSSIERVKPFARHSRYIEEKLYVEDWCPEFFAWKFGEKKNKEKEDLVLAEKQGMCYRDFILARRSQVERNARGKKNT